MGEASPVQIPDALDLGGVGLWSSPAGSGGLRFDDRTRRLLGLAGADQAPDLSDLVVEADRPRLADALARARQAAGEQAGGKPADGGGRVEIEFRIRRQDGAVRWLRLRGGVPPGAQGAGAPALAGATHDVTDRREREDHVRDLMRELAHRTKNTLAVAQAIARQTGAGAADIGDFRERFEARLHALGLSLDVLGEGEWLGASLTRLAEIQLDPWRDRIDVDGPELTLRADVAQNVGLALHELGANAARFGALAAPEGRVTLDWSLRPDAGGASVFALSWRESGGPPVKPPARRGLGLALLERLAPGATCEAAFEPAGLQLRIVAPEHRLIAGAR